MDLSLSATADDAGLLFHQRRQFDDGELLLLVNTSIDNASRGTVRSRARRRGAVVPGHRADRALFVSAAAGRCYGFLRVAAVRKPVAFLERTPVEPVKPTPAQVERLAPLSPPDGPPAGR